MPPSSRAAAASKKTTTTPPATTARGGRIAKSQLVQKKRSPPPPPPSRQSTVKAQVPPQQNQKTVTSSVQVEKNGEDVEEALLAEELRREIRDDNDNADKVDDDNGEDDDDMDDVVLRGSQQALWESFLRIQAQKQGHHEEAPTAGLNEAEAHPPVLTRASASSRLPPKRRSSAPTSPPRTFSTADAMRSHTTITQDPSTRDGGSSTFAVAPRITRYQRLHECLHEAAVHRQPAVFIHQLLSANGPVLMDSAFWMHCACGFCNRSRRTGQTGEWPGRPTEDSSLTNTTRTGATVQDEVEVEYGDDGSCVYVSLLYAILHASPPSSTWTTTTTTTRNRSELAELAELYLLLSSGPWAPDSMSRMEVDVFDSVAEGFVRRAASPHHSSESDSGASSSFSSTTRASLMGLYAILRQITARLEKDLLRYHSPSSSPPVQASAVAAPQGDGKGSHHSGTLSSTETMTPASLRTAGNGQRSISAYRAAIEQAIAMHYAVVRAASGSGRPTMDLSTGFNTAAGGAEESSESHPGEASRRRSPAVSLSAPLSRQTTTITKTSANGQEPPQDETSVESVAMPMASRQEQQQQQQVYEEEVEMEGLSLPSTQPRAPHHIIPPRKRSREHEEDRDTTTTTIRITTGAMRVETGEQVSSSSTNLDGKTTTTTLQPPTTTEKEALERNTRRHSSGSGSPPSSQLLLPSTQPPLSSTTTTRVGQDAGWSRAATAPPPLSNSSSSSSSLSSPWPSSVSSVSSPSPSSRHEPEEVRARPSTIAHMTEEAEGSADGLLLLGADDNDDEKMEGSEEVTPIVRRRPQSVPSTADPIAAAAAAAPGEGEDPHSSATRSAKEEEEEQARLSRAIEAFDRFNDSHQSHAQNQPASITAEGPRARVPWMAARWNNTAAAAVAAASTAARAAARTTNATSETFSPPFDTEPTLPATLAAPRRTAAAAASSARGGEGKPSGTKRQRRYAFTPAEDEAILQGVAKFGSSAPSKFRLIMAMYPQAWHPERTVSQLYDHWRQVLRHRITRHLE